MEAIALLPVALISIITALVMAIIGMRKDAQKKKEEAKKIYKRMNIAGAIGFVSLGIALFWPEPGEKSVVQSPALIETDNTPDFSAAKLTEVEKEMLKIYHENFSSTSWYRKELSVTISKWDEDYYKLSLFTEMQNIEANMKVASELTGPFFGMVNANGATLKGRVYTIEVYGKNNELLYNQKNPLVK